MRKMNRDMREGIIYLIVSIIITTMLILPTALADTTTEEKIVKTTVNLTIEEIVQGNNTNYKFKLEGPQNTYNLDSVQNSTNAYEFLNIYEMTCTTDSLSDMFKNYSKTCEERYANDCVNEDGVSYKEKYDGVLKNYQECKVEKDNITEKLEDVKTLERETSDNLITANAALNNAKTEKTDAEQWKDYTVMLVILVAIGGGAYYFKHMKEVKPKGPHKEFPRDEPPGAQLPK